MVITNMTIPLRDCRDRRDLGLEMDVWKKNFGLFEVGWAELNDLGSVLPAVGIGYFLLGRVGKGLVRWWDWANHSNR